MLQGNAVGDAVSMDMVSHLSQHADCYSQIGSG